MKDQLRFGYNQGIPEDRETAWGCRLIVTQQGKVDFVWDRQDTYGPESRREKLHALLNGVRYGNVTLFKQMLENVSVLLKSQRMDTRESKEFVVLRTPDITIKANTNASAGYCYVCAYFTYAEEEREGQPA